MVSASQFAFSARKPAFLVFWRSPVLVYDAAMTAEWQLCIGRFLQYSLWSHFLRDGESKEGSRGSRKPDQKPGLGRSVRSFSEADIRLTFTNKKQII